MIGRRTGVSRLCGTARLTGACQATGISTLSRAVLRCGRSHGGRSLRRTLPAYGAEGWRLIPAGRDGAVAHSIPTSSARSSLRR